MCSTPVCEVHAHCSFRPFPRPKILPFDHINPPLTQTVESPPRTAIFYATPTSPNFRELHSYLLSLSNTPQPRVEYIFRHIPSENRGLGGRSHLSGYGVTLDLKKMDYLALDDRHSVSPGIHTIYCPRPVIS